MKELKLPEDYTGKSPTNLRKGEVVQTVNRKVRAILPEYGAFFAKSAEIIDLATGKALKRGVQFFAVEMYPVLTQRAGQEVCAILLVVDETVSNDLSITYQAIGGENGYSHEALQALIDGANIDGRVTDFYDIQGRPAKYPVAAHQHDGRDVYGWDFVVRELRRMTEVVQVGSVQSRLQALDLIIRVLANVMNEAEKAIQAQLVAHREASLAHTQYVSKNELAERISLIRQPNADYRSANGTVTLLGTPYTSFYGVPQAGAHFQVSRQADFASVLVDRSLGAVVQYLVTETLPKNVPLYARVKYRDQDGVESTWSIPIGFTLT